MSEKISLVQQDELSVSAEIVSSTISWLRWNRSRRSSAAAAPPTPTEMPWGCFPPCPAPPGHQGMGERECTAPMEHPVGRGAPASWVTPQDESVHRLLLALARGGEQPAHLGAQHGVSMGRGEHLSALHPTAW